MEKCGQCNRGLIDGELCSACNGTMFLDSVPETTLQKVVRKVKKVVKRKK